MKIIGSTKEGVLISAEVREVAQIMGRRSEYDLKNAGLSIKPGMDINVGPMFDWLEQIKSYDLKIRQIGIDAERIRAMAQDMPELFTCEEDET